MTEKAQFRLPSKELGHTLVCKGWEWAKTQIALEKVVLVEFKLETRTDRQNRLLHALFGDIAKSAEFGGIKRSPDFWKSVLISAHSTATEEEMETFVGLEGEVVTYRESSAKMTKRRMASLLEYTMAHMAENEIPISAGRQWMD